MSNNFMTKCRVLEVFKYNINMDIRKLRKDKHLTQQALGEALGMTATAIGKYEAKINEPSIETLKKMSKIFGVSIDTIVGNETDYFLDMRLYSDDCIKLIRTIAEMPDSKIQKISGYIAGLKDK